MNGTKLLLIAASTIALAACGGAEVEEDTAAIGTENESYAEAETVDDDSALGAEQLVEPDQPPLEGDSPFVDAQDVAQSRLDQGNYDSGFDGTDLREPDDPLGVGMEEGEIALAEGDDVSGYGVGDEIGSPDVDEIETADLDEDEIVTQNPDAEAGLLDDDIDMAATVGQNDMNRTQQRTAQTTQGGSGMDIPAAQETVRETDARIASGEVITGSEAALLSGTYEVEIAGMDEPRLLYIDGRGNRAGGTFAGEPISVAVTGRNFQFDAPVMMDGEEELMTFTGTLEQGGMIDNGVVSAEGGDGSSMTFTAERLEGDVKVGPNNMAGDQ